MTMVEKVESETLADLLSPCVAQVEADLASWGVEPGTPAELREAMEYCLAGGKRLRPAITLLSAEATGSGQTDSKGEQEELIHRAAVAVELIHVYSLVHDDLPAMDDDDLRRGRATAHVKYGQAMGVLVGDALLTRAFGLLADHRIKDETTAARTVQLVTELGSAAGSAGMVAGQVADMDLCVVPPGVEGLRYIHVHKTGALLRASARMGAIAGGACEEHLQAVNAYAENLGLAFQLFDDLLDATSTASELGKTPGKDAKSGKRTYLTELGQDEAVELGQKLTDAAINALDPLAERGKKLKRLARLLSQRTC